MNLVKPYFKYDWLMPRAFIAICSYKDVFLHIRDYREMAVFACWKIGVKCLPNMKLNKDDEVYCISMLIYYAFQDFRRGLQCLAAILSDL